MSVPSNEKAILLQRFLFFFLLVGLRNRNIRTESCVMSFFSSVTSLLSYSVRYLLLPLFVTFTVLSVTISDFEKFTREVRTRALQSMSFQGQNIYETGSCQWCFITA